MQNSALGGPSCSSYDSRARQALSVQQRWGRPRARDEISPSQKHQCCGQCDAEVRVQTTASNLRPARDRRQTGPLLAARCSSPLVGSAHAHPGGRTIQHPHDRQDREQGRILHPSNSLHGRGRRWLASGWALLVGVGGAAAGAAS